VAIVWRREQRNVAFAAEQARCRVKTDPAGTGDVDLGPRVQVAKVVRRAFWPIERLDVRAQLDQVAGDEPRGEAEMAGDLHQEPSGVATGTGLQCERLLRR